MKDSTFQNLLNKKNFVDRVAYAICGQNRISVTEIDYEVFEHTSRGYYEEYLKVTYDGGAIATRVVTGTSESYIFKEIANLIEGGYYDEVKYYQEISHSHEYKKII